MYALIPQNTQQQQKPRKLCMYPQYNYEYIPFVISILLILFYVEEDFDDTKGVIGIRKSKKDRQHRGQKKKVKRTNNDLQNITLKTKDRVTPTH